LAAAVATTAPKIPEKDDAAKMRPIGDPSLATEPSLGDAAADQDTPSSMPSLASIGSEDRCDLQPSPENPVASPTQPSRKHVVEVAGAEKCVAESPKIDQALRCLALNIYHEARSEPAAGQVAVAAVTLNRVGSAAFPNSVCRVVKQGGEQRNRCQFSWWCDGKGDQPTESEAWQRALDIGRLALLGLTDDPTKGALYYHAEHVRPKWSHTFKRTARIGNHVFYKPAKRDLQVAALR
jgi:spore germination cell wall hydrolase CwlJ-like protein